MNVWLKLSEKDLQLSAVVVVTLFFQGKRSRRDLKFFTSTARYHQVDLCDLPRFPVERRKHLNLFLESSAQP